MDSFGPETRPSSCPTQEMAARDLTRQVRAKLILSGVARRGGAPPRFDARRPPERPQPPSPGATLGPSPTVARQPGNGRSNPSCEQEPRQGRGSIHRGRPPRMRRPDREATGRARAIATSSTRAQKAKGRALTPGSVGRSHRKDYKTRGSTKPPRERSKTTDDVQQVKPQAPALTIGSLPAKAQQRRPLTAQEPEPSDHQPIDPTSSPGRSQAGSAQSLRETGPDAGKELDPTEVHPMKKPRDASQGITDQWDSHQGSTLPFPASHNDVGQGEGARAANPPRDPTTKHHPVPTIRYLPPR